jgi:hypothetical protein
LVDSLPVYINVSKNADFGLSTSKFSDNNYPILSQFFFSLKIINLRACLL